MSHLSHSMMSRTNTRTRRTLIAASIACALCAGLTGTAFAEDPAPAVAVTPPPPAPPPPPAEPSYPALTLGAWGRIATVLQGSPDREKLNDVSQNAEVDLVMAGRIHKYISFVANLVGTYGGGAITGNIQILDLIAQFECHELFNVWVGRMLVPSDRSNFSGPWFMSPWKYPGTEYAGGFVGPKTGPTGRDDGATVWGQFAGGKAKYYLSALELNDATASPLYSGRINLCLLGS